MQKIKALLVCMLLFSLSYQVAVAQSPGFEYNVEAQAGFTPSGKLPFWLRADQNGSIPLTGLSSSFIGSVFKSYTKTKSSDFDWGGGIEVRANAGNYSHVTLLQGYLKAKKGIFEIKAGRFNQMSGIVDSTLSTGAFSISNNALGIPQLRISIPNYYQLPFFDKLFSVKAGYAVGIVGDTRIGLSTYLDHATAYYQQNFAYVKLGKPGWKLSLYGGINHHVMFTNESKVYGPNFTLSLPMVFVYTAIGKTYYPQNVNDPDQRRLVSKVGNHIGSIDMSLQYEFDNVRLMAYRQNLYDIGAIGHFANIQDGINGISLTNKKFNAQQTDWRKLLFEIVYTKNQAGYYNSTFTSSGDENYYNNYEYLNGWTYQGLNLGNPLLTDAQYTRAGLAIDLKDDYIIDNRVWAFNAGMEGAINNINFQTKLTYSLNYGTYGTSPEGHSHSKVFFPPKFGQFGTVRQFSGYVEGNKTLANNFTAGIAVATDVGQLYYNSVGVMLKLKKTFH